MASSASFNFAVKIDHAERASKARAAGEVADFHGPVVGRRTMTIQEKDFPVGSACQERQRAS